MKNLNVIALVALLGAALTAHTQTTNEEVKILPANEKGFIKVLFVGQQSSDVQVKFYNDQGLYTLDNIARSSFEKGFVKKYDIRHIHKGENFRIEVEAKDFVTTYRMEAKDKAAYEPKLERIEQHRIEMVASKD